MSDHIPPEVVQQQLDAQFQIPNEVWTDILKLLPCRVLIQQLAPVSFRFKEICDKNVKNVHVITKAEQFHDKLEEDDPKANKQLEQLTADDCQLASQFQLTNLRIGVKSQAILRHCPDLLTGCQITTTAYHAVEENFILDSLTELERAKPAQITVYCKHQMVDFWHHPTFQNCNRVKLHFLTRFSDAVEGRPQKRAKPDAPLMDYYTGIFDWLHHQPTGGGMSLSADHSADHDHGDQQVRGMIVWMPLHHMDWLLDRCSKMLQQAQGPTDRRPYVLSVGVWLSEWAAAFDQFRRVENKSTGEVLVLDHVLDGNGAPTHRFRLRRCLLAEEEEARGKELFYAGMFKQEGGFGLDAFNIGDKTPKVVIG